MQPTQTCELSCRPGIDVVVLSEFCTPLICRVPFDATVEDVKAGFVCRSSVAYKCNPPPPQVLWSRTTRLQWTRDTFCTIGHKRVFKADGSAHQPDRGPPKRSRVPPDRGRTTHCAPSSSNSGHR